MQKLERQTARAEIGLLLYPGYHVAMVWGLTDLLQVASAFSDARGGPSLRISHWNMNASGSFVRCHDTHPSTGGQPSVLVAPAVAPDLVSKPIEGPLAAPFAAWLSERHAEGATLASTGCGAFLLAATGLLSGRPATTHWRVANKLRAAFPDIDVDTNQVVIEDGEIITAGGMMAWTDLGMRLIDRLLGPTIMVEAAQFWLIDPAGREQRHYSTFAPPLAHGDLPIVKVQHWMQAHSSRSITILDMASEAGLAERTFLRRFKVATRMKPTEYVQQLRLGKARELLQFTKRPIGQVAQEVGYGDAGAFRRLFQRFVGLSPGEYRRRFVASRAE